MKSSKLISSAITMLFFLISFGQEKSDTIIKKSNTIIRCRPSLSSNQEVLYIVNNFIVSKEFIKTINPENIVSVTVLNKQNGRALCGSSGEGVVVIKTNLPNRKIIKMKKNIEIKKIIDTIE